jgi:hypothetical protein
MYGNIQVLCFAWVFDWGRIYFEEIAISSETSVPTTKLRCVSCVKSGNVDTKDLASLSGHRKPAAAFRNRGRVTQLLLGRHAAPAIVFATGNAFLTQPSSAVTTSIQSDIIFNNVCVCVCVFVLVISVSLLWNVADSFLVSFQEHHFQVNKVTCDFYFWGNFKD